MGGVYGSSHDACGEMSVSPDGNRIACAYNYSAIFELYDFDILTGIVSNPITISNVPHIWGIEFSPDSKKLYTTLWTQTEVAQYDISTNNAVAIAASKYVAGNVPYSGSYACGYLELAPNGVIYIAKWNGTDMSQINNPDSLGTACGFTNAGFNLGGGINQCGLSPSPVFPSSVGAGIESLSASNFQISPNPVRNEFTVTLTDEMIPSEKSHLSLYTVEGKFIKSIPVTSRETIVKRGKLTAGIYICELNLDGKILASQKILVE
jgi:WD40 repeat protein